MCQVIQYAAPLSIADEEGKSDREHGCLDTLDKERWKRLSPQLDELLELTASGREQRIASIRAVPPRAATFFAG